VVNPTGEDIWGYEAFAEYTPVNALTLRAGVQSDNMSDDLGAYIGLRFNYKFGASSRDLMSAPDYDLTSVADRRFDKVQRINEIRVQERQRPGLTAMVVFAQGANVAQGASIAFGTTITTGGAGGDGVSVRFGNGAVLNLGLNTTVRIDADQIVLQSGTLQYVSAAGGITNLVAPGSTIALLGTDVDLITDGTRTTLRVRDGAADYTDETGTTRVDREELAESRLDDGLPPQLRGEAEPVSESHATQVHEQIHLSLPSTVTQRSAAYSDSATVITGTLGIGNTLTFTVPVTQVVAVTETPQLLFRFGGVDRLASYSSGSGTDRLVFTYTITGADVGLSGITAQEIRKNGGTLTGANGLPMVLSLGGTFSGSIAADTTPDAFSFTDQTNVALSTVITSNSITVAGINTNAAISIAGDGSPEFRINGGAWTSAATTVNNGDTVELRLTSASGGGVLHSATLDIGGVTDQWDVTTLSDDAPDAFSFTDQTNVAVSTLITSDSVTVAGLNTAAAISISGDGSPEFRINGGTWTCTATTVANGDTVELRLTSAASGGVLHSATLDIGGVTDQWDVTTLSDDAPDAFSFTDQTDVAVSTLITSDSVTVSGLNTPAAISISGDGSPEFRINGGTWTSTATTVSNGDSVELRLTSAASGGVLHSATLDIGGVTDQWDVTTLSDDAPDAFSFTDQTGVAVSTLITSDSVTVSGLNTASAISISGDGTPEFRINGGTWTSTATTVSNGDTVELRLTSAASGGVLHSATLDIGGVTDQWDVTTLSDTTPDAFSFTDQTGVAVSTLITSDSVTVAGINTAAAISISGDGSPEFRINGGTWTSTATTVANGDTVELRLTSAASGAVLHSATLDIGGVTDQWDVTTLSDTTPDAFSFTDQTGVAVSTLISSDSITVSGLNTAASISISGDGSPEFRINGGTWTSTATTVSNGDTVELRLTSAAGGGVLHSATLDIGGVTDQWDVTTISDTTPDAFSFTDQTGVAVSSLITSDSITVAGINTAAAISISGDGSPEFRINGGTWTSTATTVANGDTVELRLTSAASGGVLHSATLDIGGVTDQWDVTTLSDSTPDAFSFTDQTGVAVSTVISSDSITVAGINTSAAISISGDGSPEFRINGGTWTSTATTVANGDTVELRLTSAASGGVLHSATLDIGGVTDQWDVTTAAPAPTGCPNIGDVCSEGSIYAGDYLGSPLYTKATDQGQLTWGPVTTTGATSFTDGAANTDILVGLSGTYPAAEACRALGAEWYLPSRDELDVLYTNRVAIGGFNTSGTFPAGWYWSSSEGDSNYSFTARDQRFSDGTPNGNSKYFELAVRCVRR
jgi:uncharacterized protein YdeI (BOF family)